MSHKNQTHFDVSRIVKIEIFEKYSAYYKWLPRKQKTSFFGLIKLNKYYEEGFYMYGSYKNGSYDCEWDQTPMTYDDLIQSGYLIDTDKKVWNRPRVIVYLEYKGDIFKTFNTFEEAWSWVNDLKSLSGKKFEIVHHG